MHHLLVWPVGRATRAGGLRGQGGPGAQPGAAPPCWGRHRGRLAQGRWGAERAPLFPEEGHKTNAAFRASGAVSGRPFLPLEVSILLHTLDLGMHEWAHHNGHPGKKGQPRGPHKARHFAATVTEGKQHTLLSNSLNSRRKFAVENTEIALIFCYFNTTTKSGHLHRLNVRGKKTFRCCTVTYANKVLHLCIRLKIIWFFDTFGHVWC